MTFCVATACLDGSVTIWDATKMVISSKKRRCVNGTHAATAAANIRSNLETCDRGCRKAGITCIGFSKTELDLPDTRHKDKAIK